MRKSFIVAVLLITSNVQIHAQVLTKNECSPIDIRSTNPLIKKNPSLRNHFTVPRNQDSIGWCYGFAAADLLSAHLGTDVSAFHVSALYNRKARKNIFMRLGHELGGSSFDEVYEGGWCEKALNEAKKNGKVCREKDLPFDHSFSSQTYGMIYSLEAIRRERKNYSEPQLCNAVNFYLNKTNDLSVDANHITEELISNNMNIVLEKIANEQCKDKSIPVPTFKVKTIPTTSGRSVEKSKLFLNRVSNLLQNGKPLEISYDVKHYTHSSGFHSSVLTGRRWYNGKCQFKIRNSWGKSCAPYNSLVNCEKETGSFWVNDEHFVKSTRDTSYIE